MSYEPTDCDLGYCDHKGCHEEPEDPRGDFIELGDSIPDASSKILRGEGDVAKTEDVEPAGYIDCTPSWHAIVGLYLEMLDRPEIVEDKRQELKAEILRAAKLADLYVKEHKR